MMGISERAIPPPSLQSVLAAWRAAERALTQAPPSSDERERASHDFEALQAEYHDLASLDLAGLIAPARPDDRERGAT